MNNKKEIIDSSDSSSDISVSSISYSSVSSSDLKKIKENPKIKNLIDENKKQSNFDWKTYINNYRSPFSFCIVSERACILATPHQPAQKRGGTPPAGQCLLSNRLASALLSHSYNFNDAFLDDRY